MHAGLVGKWLIESLARVPVEVSIASEFRYNRPLLLPGQQVIAISQSGETADTLAAVRLAKARAPPRWAWSTCPARAWRARSTRR